ncbi:signal transduction histidine kinase [Sphingomonas sp. BE138]|uniref:sensor histidine kinase n=1 Tax=Sphingomonas sp. BE138 TaxID=2817845 RepID=UPI0028587048|nr:HAMP domain-containing sensor histidine kinase [Sphingomonas sp. BE138]MDR6786767.1 signal transduction histidine kinase [Sphingomonas sp. BE138]
MTRGAFHALVDADDRVLSGDARFAELNDRAAGCSGAGLALATVGALVRIARGLRVPVARTLTIGDEHVDGDWHVRAVPGEDHTVALAATLVRERPIASPAPGAVVAVEPPVGAAWTWEVDAGLRVVRVGAEALGREGLDPVAIIGHPLTSLFVLEARDDGAMPLLEAVSTVRDFAGQVARLRANGVRIALAASVRRDAAGAFAGFVGGVFTVVPDVGETRLTGEFNTRLHRVLRTPLGEIIARAESIRAADAGPVDAHYIDYAADIASAGRHLLGLVDDLVNMEAIERADFSTVRDRIDMAEVAREAAGLLAARAASREVTIAPLAGESSALATGEYRRALQIVVNLLGNAVTYSPAGSIVRMRLKRRDGQIRLLVADQGRGIPVHEQQRIFDKFARGDDSEPGGSGLGLYIARRLAQAMDGSLTVESEPGEGATFRLDLPPAAL